MPPGAEMLRKNTLRIVILKDPSRPDRALAWRTRRSILIEREPLEEWLVASKDATTGGSPFINDNYARKWSVCPWIKVGKRWIKERFWEKERPELFCPGLGWYGKRI
jgi:hypothetical protein